MNKRLHSLSSVKKFYKNSNSSLQNLILSFHGITKSIEFYSTSHQKLVRNLETSQLLDRREVENRQIMKLRRLLNHASNTVPYYSKLFKDNNIVPSRIKSIKDLTNIPLLTKEMVRKEGSTITSEKSHLYNPEEYFTGGSTGKPLSFLMDNSSLIYRSAEKYRHWKRHGYKFRDKMAVLRGTMIEYDFKSIKPWRYDCIQNFLYLSSYHLDPGNLSEYVKILKKFKPKFIQAYPSSGYILARYLNQTEEIIPLEGFFTGSETVYSHHRKEIEKAFDCKVIDHYGHGEPGTWITGQCICGRYIISEDISVIELLDESGNQIESGVGRIVETSLNNFSMPFIRYDTGDIAEVENKSCRCGNGIRVLKRVVGREGDYLIIGNRKVSGAMFLNQVLKKMENIVEMQVCQTHDSKIVIRVVPSKSFSSTNEEKLRNRITERLGSQIELTFEIVKEIEKSPSGKKRYVVSELKTRDKY